MQIEHTIKVLVAKMFPSDMFRYRRRMFMSSTGFFSYADFGIDNLQRTVHNQSSLEILFYIAPDSKK